MFNLVFRSTSRRRFSLLLALCLLIILLSPAAHAQGPADPNTTSSATTPAAGPTVPDPVKAELDELRSQIRVLQDRLETLSRGAAAATPAQASTQQTPPATPAKPETTPGRGQTDTSLYYGLSAGAPDK